MKRTAMLAMVALAISFTAQSQYGIPYYYLGYGSYDPYANRFIGSSFFSLPRPNDTYTSTRMRSLAEGFKGLVRDPFTDHFRNPAWHVCETNTEVFGDFGSVNDLGKFFLGSFIHTATDSSKGMVGVNMTLDKMMKSTSKSSSENTSSGSSTRSNSSSLSESNPERVGGRLSYSWQVSEKIDLGVSYEFISRSDGSHFESSYGSTPASGGSTSSQGNDDTFDGKIHTANFGSIIKSDKGVLQLFVRGIYSTNALLYSYQRKGRSNYSQSTEETRLPTDVDTKAGLIGAVYEIEHESNAVTRFLFEAAITKYTASGKTISFSESGDTIRITFRSSTAGSRSTDGTIWDIKGGVARELPISEALKGIAGFTVNYVKNTFDGSEESVTSYITSPPQLPPPPTTQRNILDSSLDGFDVRLPIGLEYSLSENVLLSGGIEPRYRSGEITEGQTSSALNPIISTSVNKTENTMRGLQFSTQVGISFNKEDFGVLSVLLGRNVADMTYWSVFLRYFL